MNWIKRLFGDGTLSVVAIADHVEIADTHLVLGLKLDCFNSAKEPVFIQDVRLKVYLEGRKAAPRPFKTLERFARVPAQRGFQKTAATQFQLRPKETHIEQIRFLGQEVRDIVPGEYLVEIQMTDINVTNYTRRSKIQIENKIKYRLSDEWQND